MRLDWKHLEVRLKACGYSLWERGVHCSRTWQHHFVSDNDIWIFDTGKGVMDMVGSKTQLHKNCIIWMRPGHDYSVDQDPDDPIGQVYIHFDLIRPDGSLYCPDISDFPETFECFNHAHWHAMGRNIVRIMNLAEYSRSVDQRQDIRETASILLKSMLMGIDLCDTLAHPDNIPSKTNMIAIQAAEYLSDEQHNFRSIQNVAKHFSLSRNHFTRIFTDFWHISPQDYQIAQRIRRARQLLSSTNSSLSEIANQLGYSDRFFFSRQFKEKTGLSPGIYRSRSAYHERKEDSP